MKRTTRTLLIATVAVAAIALAVGAIDAALAQGSPFGVGTPKSAPAATGTGIVGWIMVKQAEFYKGLAGAIRTAKTDWYGLWLLLGLSFAYGVFHAAGPGHGKAVISSYVVANRETWWRGVVLSFASAMVQATVAVVLVGIAAVLLNATAATMKTTVYWIEIISYLLIIAIGLRLIWAKGRAMLTTWRDIRTPKTVGAAATPAHLRDDRDHDHATTTMLTMITPTMITRITITVTSMLMPRTIMPRTRITTMLITTMLIPRTATITTVMTMRVATTTVRPGAMPTRRSRASWRVRAAGSAA